jgi:hypothetical protein
MAQSEKQVIAALRIGEEPGEQDELLEKWGR